MKSALVGFLINAGTKLRSVAGFNFLRNNDGLNLDAPQQFRYKEISKSNAVNDTVAAKSILYAPDEHPDHTSAQMETVEVWTEALAEVNEAWAPVQTIDQQVWN